MTRQVEAEMANMPWLFVVIVSSVVDEFLLKSTPTLLQLGLKSTIFRLCCCCSDIQNVMSTLSAAFLALASHSSELNLIASIHPNS